MLELKAPTQLIQNRIKLSGSKSISNRLLLLKHILKQNTELTNLSDSEDTQLLIKALEQISGSRNATINIEHAGTDMRFLTALLSATEGEWILTGSERMKQRPITELVNALTQLGASIQYLENEGYPPLKILGKKISGGKIKINAGISSQFISALLLVAPTFEIGLELELEGKMVSAPYVEMTINLLQRFNIEIVQEGNKIQTFHTGANPHSTDFLIESDWSSASYWYAICALTNGSSLELRHLNEKSLQADSVLPVLFEQLGVKTKFTNRSLAITQVGNVTKKIEYDFTNCPDIAPTFAVACFGLGVEAKLYGLQTLKIKESDRILAVKTELEKLGAKIELQDNALIVLRNANQLLKAQTLKLETYKDHRIAMSFAPLCLICKSVLIEDHEVVKKSYSSFWSDLKNVGFNVNLQT